MRKVFVDYNKKYTVQLCDPNSEIKIGDWYIFNADGEWKTLICAEQEDADRCNKDPSVAPNCMKIIASYITRDNVLPISEEHVKRLLNTHHTHVYINTNKKCEELCSKGTAEACKKSGCQIPLWKTTVDGYVDIVYVN